MKKLLVSLFALMAAFGAPCEVQAMPVMQGAIKGNLLPGAVQGALVSTHSTVATQTTYSWSTVDLGATLNRKVALFVTWRGSGAARSFVSGTVNGVEVYHIKTQTNTLNSVALLMSDEPAGTTNSTVSITLSGDAVAMSLVVMRLATAQYLAPTSVAAVTADAGAMTVYGPENGIVLSCAIAQSTSPSATWTNNTEVLDAAYNGSTLHTAAIGTITTAESSRSVSVDVAGTVTDLAAMTVTFQPADGKAFIYHTRDDLNNTADASSYTFAGVNIGPPAEDRKLIYLVSARSPNGGTRSMSSVDLGTESVSYQFAANTQTSAYNMLFLSAMAVPATLADDTATLKVYFAGAVYDCSLSVVVVYGLQSETALDGIEDFNSASSSVVGANLTGVVDDSIVVGMTTSYSSTNLTVTGTYDGGAYTPVDLYLGQYQNLALTLLERRTVDASTPIYNTWSSSNPASYVMACFL